MTVARQLAEFLTATTTADLPAQALDNAAMLIASTIASAACGNGLESARIIRDLARDHGGRPDASLWFDAGAKLPVADVAQANAVASDAAASDDSDLRNIVHAGTPLTATALAFAERNGADGAAVLTAMVLGYEAAGRISEAITPGFRNRGFHGCLGAIFAATVAAGRLLQLDAEQMAQAIALSATSIGGLATAADTSVAREYHAGPGRDARGERGAGRATRLPRGGRDPGNAERILRGVRRRRWRHGRGGRDQRPRCKLGHHDGHGDKAGAGRPSAPRHSPKPPPKPRGTATSPPKRSRASPFRAPA